MAQHNIEKWDPVYSLLRKYVNLNFRMYFRNIYVQGKHNIPADAPVIFAPNHQNALMDALALIYTLPGQPVFMGRADIFKKKTIARILTFVKILPVYRLRDGYDSLQNNDRIIQKVTDVLSGNHSLVIFPEGNHGYQRKLRPLKKGVSRMAFQTEERNHFKLGLYIVPVGIDYEDYYKFHKSLLINFGEPIAVDTFNRQYRESPSKAYISLRNKIAEGLKKVMIHIPSESYYDLINTLRDIYRVRAKEMFRLPKLRHPEKFRADRELVEICEEQIENRPEEVEQLDEKVQDFQSRMSRLNFKYWLFDRKRYSMIRLLASLPLFLLFLPVFLYGLINNALPFFLPGLANRNIKDSQFHSSIRNGLALLLFPLFYLIQLGVFSIMFNGFCLNMGYLLSLPITGYLAYQYYRLLKKWWAKWRYNLFRLKSPQRFRQMHELREEILQTVDRWVTGKELREQS